MRKPKEFVYSHRSIKDNIKQRALNNSYDASQISDVNMMKPKYEQENKAKLPHIIK